MKETFYFTHDYNARTDAKIKKLIVKYGYLGYGIYWAIIEDLYQNNNRLEADYDLIAYDLRNDSSVIKSIINDFDLFVVSDGFFGSLSIEKRLDERNEKSKKATENANKRWGNKVLHAQECIFYVLRFFGNNEEFIKCGITTESVSRRYSGKTGVYNYEILFQKELSVTDGIELERSIRSIAKNYTPNIKIAGYNECYEIDYQYDILNFAMQCESNGNAKIENGNAKKEIKVNESKGDEKKIKNTLLSDLEKSEILIEHEKIALSFWRLIKSNVQSMGGSVAQIENANVKNWVTPIRLMMDKDGITIEQLRAVKKALDPKEPNHSKFWVATCLSTDSLRRNFNKIMAAYNNPQKQNYNNDDRRDALIKLQQTALEVSRYASNS